VVPPNVCEREVDVREQARKVRLMCDASRSLS
jgi:hypothetical protein